MLSVRIPHPAIEGGLEGRATSADRPRAVAAPPHPLYGGNFDNPVVVALGRGLVRRGIATLAFNWRGVGTSAGRASGEIDDCIADYRAAVDHVTAARDPDRGIVAAGYSFGAAAALGVAAGDARVTELLLVAPPLGMLPPELSSPARRPLATTLIVAEQDEFAPMAAVERFAAAFSATLVVVTGADHFFSRGGFDRIEAAAAAPQVAE